MSPKLYTAAQVAEKLGLSHQRINAIARRRGIGQMIGNTRVFTVADVAAIKPGPPGRPKKNPQHQ